MTTLDPAHFPQLHRPSRGKHAGDAVVQSRSRAGSGSLTHGIKTIPDMRFEQSYLKSIALHVKTRRVDEDGPIEVVGIDWRKVAWITARDQLISPLLQGAVWGVASIFIRPIFSGIRSFFGFSRRLDPPKPKPKAEGELTRRLREWSKSLTSGLETNVALSR
ncbi:hypothetical protein M0805_001315 [Coniferiporia weirii]|nr:hypothetical protein M0805_001315 [Coniferiporia weirii]